MMMMIFSLFLQKQQIAYRHTTNSLPLYSHLSTPLSGLCEGIIIQYSLGKQKSHFDLILISFRNFQL